MKYSTYNVVIIGSGLAGLYLANKLSQSENASSDFSEGILVVTKSKLMSGSTKLAQGGIVSVVPELNSSDSVESHIQDTLKAGCGINNINTVKFVSEKSGEVLQELLRLGVNFDRNPNNTLNFTLEGAHSHPRILHAHGDSTGRIIEETLCADAKNAKNIDIYENTIAIEVLLDESNCARGVVVYNYLNNSYEVIYSNNIVVATGGVGQLYKNTTNPVTSTADGIALCAKAGADCENMEFVQFHPTGLYCKDKNPTPLVSESVRGEGAKLVDINGEYFAKNYHPQADLAPRDVVARAIYEQINITNSEYVNLDISQIGIQKFKMRFPTITSLCEKNNIDINSGLIPVVPVQHYFMGGVKVDLNSKTSINNLYAIGECASTGLHGANRLASNSLLECAVFADTLANYLIKNPSNPPKKQDTKIRESVEKYVLPDSAVDCDIENIKELFNRLKETMSCYVGIIRNEKGLCIANKVINDIDKTFKQSYFPASLEKFELQNAIYTSKLIISGALKRTESIGAHYRNDNKSADIKLQEGSKNYGKLLA